MCVAKVNNGMIFLCFISNKQAQYFEAHPDHNFFIDFHRPRISAGICGRFEKAALTGWKEPRWLMIKPPI
jgi:hypothetical protein